MLKISLFFLEGVYRMKPRFYYLLGKSIDSTVFKTLWIFNIYTYLPFNYFFCKCRVFLNLCVGMSLNIHSFSFQPVLHNLFNQCHCMCYPVAFYAYKRSLATDQNEYTL